MLTNPQLNSYDRASMPVRMGSGGAGPNHVMFDDQDELRIKTERRGTDV